MERIFVNRNYRLLNNVVQAYEIHKWYGLKSFFKKPSGIIGFSLLLILVLMAIIVPLITPRYFGDDPYISNTARKFIPSFSSKDGTYFIFGTDSTGFDLFSRIFYGLGYSLIISLAVVAIDIIVGITIGMAMGYFPVFRKYMYSIIATVSIIPSLVIYLILGVILGPSVGTLIFSICLFGWIPMAIIVDSKVRQYKYELFSTASKVLGTPTRKILFSYIPLILPLILTQMMTTITASIYTESTISILGLGLIGTPTLGSVLEANIAASITYPMLVVWPLIIIISISVSIQLIRQAIQKISLERKR
jgi:oligopeptide transport system permease protein